MKVQWSLVTIISILFFLGNQFQFAEDLPSLPDEDKQLVFQIYKQLVETNTTNSVGDNTLAAQRMANWL